MSLLIKGAQIVDGLGSEPYKADVLVQQNTISAIGNLRGRKADTIIDGLGNYLTPGFIDIHSTSDHYLSLFDNPAQEDFIRQGVTTTIGGHCGGSLAPLLYGTLESLKKWSGNCDININWHSVVEFRNSFEKVKLGVNFGTLVGYNTIRYALSGDRIKSNTNEINVLKEILKEAMQDGAFGLSTGLEDIYNKRIPKKEIEELVSVLKPFNGIYATHLRNETDQLVEAVQETIDIAERTGVTSIISHFRPIKKYGKEFKKALELISTTDAPVYFDISLYPVSVMPIYGFLPAWVQKDDYESMLERINNKKSEEIIKKEWGRINADKIWVYGAPGHEYLVSKTIRTISEDLDISPRDAMLHIMRETKLNATLITENVDEEKLIDALHNKHAFISTNGNSVIPGAFMKHEKSFNTFSKFIEMESKRPDFSLPETISSITCRPARFLNLHKRGVIEEGNVADLVIIGKNDYQVRDVIVGGALYRDGEMRGKILAHSK